MATLLALPLLHILLYWHIGCYRLGHYAGWLLVGYEITVGHWPLPHWSGEWSLWSLHARHYWSLHYVNITVGHWLRQILILVILRRLHYWPPHYAIIVTLHITIIGWHYHYGHWHCYALRHWLAGHWLLVTAYYVGDYAIALSVTLRHYY